MPVHHPHYGRILLAHLSHLPLFADFAEDNEAENESDESNGSDDDCGDATGSDVVAVLFLVHPVAAVVPVITNEMLGDAAADQLQERGGQHRVGPAHVEEGQEDVYAWEDSRVSCAPA